MSSTFRNISSACSTRKPDLTTRGFARARGHLRQLSLPDLLGCVPAGANRGQELVPRVHYAVEESQRVLNLILLVEHGAQQMVAWGSVDVLWAAVQCVIVRALRQLPPGFLQLGLRHVQLAKVLVQLCAQASAAAGAGAACGRVVAWAN